MKKVDLESMKTCVLGINERKLLLKALDVDYKSMTCEYCKDKVPIERVGIFPGVYKDTIITCDSPLCICEYFNDIESKNKEFDKEDKISKQELKKRLSKSTFIEHLTPEQQKELDDVINLTK